MTDTNNLAEEPPFVVRFSPCHPYFGCGLGLGVHEASFACSSPPGRRDHTEVSRLWADLGVSPGSASCSRLSEFATDAVDARLMLATLIKASLESVVEGRLCSRVGSAGSESPCNTLSCAAPRSGCQTKYGIRGCVSCQTNTHCSGISVS